MLDNSGGIRGSNGYQEIVSGDRQPNVVQLLYVVVLAMAYRWFEGKVSQTLFLKRGACLFSLIPLTW